MILLFDYNFLVLLVDEDFMVCPTTFIMKILKFGEPLVTDLDYKGIHSNETTRLRPKWFLVFLMPFYVLFGLIRV